MIWLFERGNRATRLVTRFDPATSEYILDVDWSAVTLETGPDGAPPPRGPEGRYKRPYEGTDNKAAAMQAYLDWEYGLVAQLERDGTHGFFVI